MRMRRKESGGGDREKKKKLGLKTAAEWKAAPLNNAQS